MSKIKDFDWTITLDANDETTDQKVTMSIEQPQVGKCSLVKPLGDALAGVIRNISIGEGSQLHGREMYCQALITDFDTQSNRVTLIIKSGKYSKSFSADVDHQGESIQLNVTVIYI